MVSAVGIGCAGLIVGRRAVRGQAQVEHEQPRQQGQVHVQLRVVG